MAKLDVFCCTWRRMGSIGSTLRSRLKTKMRPRPKLLIVAGAGSAIEFGMPSTESIHNLFLQVASEYFPLARDPAENLYGYLYKMLEQHWSTHELEQAPNFEDALHVICQLAAMHPDSAYRKFTPPLGAFTQVKRLPDVDRNSLIDATDSALMMHLAQRLVHDLVDAFRKKCIRASLDSNTTVTFGGFFSLLMDQFDIAVVSTNYDDLIYRALPGIETGFDRGDRGLFKQDRILRRRSWPCLLHLHGSVHFEEDTDGDRNAVLWKDDLSSSFYQDSLLSAPFYSISGYAFPSSPIVVGYAKAEKIGRPPFRTYYSELARLVYASDALLVLGHSLGLGDTHLREAFSGYSDSRRRRVVFVDYSTERVS
jgi:hypothetical protein